MKKVIFSVIIAVLLSMAGCSKTELPDNSYINDHSNLDVVFAKFPSGEWLETKYYLDGDLYSYSEVECAYYYHDGQTEVIDRDDPRLTFLLNLLLKSEEDMTTSIQHSYIEAEEIRRCYEAKDSMLEVVFKKPYQQHVRGFLICKDSYLSLLETETGNYPMVKNGDLLAERKWPLKEIVWDAISEGTVQNIDLDSSWDWGGEKWFDILAYCGF